MSQCGEEQERLCLEDDHTSSQYLRLELHVQPDGLIQSPTMIRQCCSTKKLGTEAAGLAAASLLQNTREHTTERTSQHEPPLPLEKFIRDGGHHENRTLCEHCCPTNGASHRTCSLAWSMFGDNEAVYNLDIGRMRIAVIRA